MDGWPAAGRPGCSIFTDQIAHLAHLHARDTSMVLVRPSPISNTEAYRTRMGWHIPRFSSTGSDFNADLS